MDFDISGAQVFFTIPTNIPILGDLQIDLFCGIILITEFHLSRLMTQMRLAVKMYLPAARNHH